MKPFSLLQLTSPTEPRSIGDRLRLVLPRLVSGVLVMLLGSGFFGTPAALAAPLSPTFPTSPTEASPALAPVGSSKLLSPPAVLPFLKGVFTGTAPDLGVTEGQLQPCPASPNCVVSQVVDPADSEHAIEPLSYSSDRETAHQVLLQVLSVVPGAAVVTDQPDYIRAEFTSKLMGFVDDGEFYFPDAAALIQVRSASRIGESDLGVNRRRIEQIRLALADLGL